MKLLLSTHSYRGLSCFLACLLVFVFSPQAPLASDIQADYAGLEQVENRQFDKNAAAAQAQAQYGGKVLSVSETGGEGKKIYKVKLLLDSGRIKIVTIHAN